MKAEEGSRRKKIPNKREGRGNPEKNNKGDTGSNHYRVRLSYNPNPKGDRVYYGNPNKKGILICNNCPCIISALPPLLIF